MTKRPTVISNQTAQVMKTCLPRLQMTSKTMQMRPIGNDGYVNVAHILQMAGKCRYDVAKLKQQKKELHLQTVRGDSKLQGTYVDFSEAIKICEEYQLRPLGMP